MLYSQTLIQKNNKMKTKSIFMTLVMCLFVITGFLVSCSSDDGGDGGGETLSSITLTSNSNEALVDVEFTFTVRDNLGNNVTSDASFTANGTAISNPHAFDETGDYTIVASYSDLTSESITITVNDPPVATSIVLNVSATDVGLGDVVSFSVLDNFGNYVSDLSTYTVNGDAATSPYTFDTSGGEFSVVAFYQDLTSNTVIINVTAPSPYTDVSTFSPSGALPSFTKKALLEDFTGTWCPNCPPAANAVSNAANANSNLFGVGYHDGFASYPDPMEIPETGFWSSYYNVTGFPTVYVNGPDTRWDFPNMDQVNNELAETAGLGLAIEANIIGGKLDLEVKVGYSSAVGEEIKLMIYLVEDNVTTSSPQSGSSSGANYVHKDVLREVYTGQLGDVISTSYIGTGGVFTRTITGLDLPSNIDNLEELKMIAYVRNTYTRTFTDYFGEVHTNSPHYDIYNVQEVEMGGIKDFD